MSRYYRNCDGYGRRDFLQVAIGSAVAGIGFSQLMGLRAQAAQRARDSGFGTIVAAGGDGTVSGVAATLAGTGLRFGVLPQTTGGCPASKRGDLRILPVLGAPVGVVVSFKSSSQLTGGPAV